MPVGSSRVITAARSILRTRLAWQRFCRAVSLSLALVLVLAIQPWPAAPHTVLAAPPPAITGLHASGKQILNASGQPVRLRGVNRTSGEYACIQNWGNFEGATNDQAIQAMLSWKINVVRIPLNEDCWLDVNTGGIDRAYVGESYRNAVIEYVNRLTTAGIVVILDLHWAAPGTQQAIGQIPMADRDHAPAFWTSVANTFKTNTAVIFDLFNESYPDDNRDTTAAWLCLRDGTNGSGTCPHVGYAAAGMQELLNAVRATGATNLVMVAGVAYTGVLSRWIEYRPTDTLNPPNIAASVHIYPGGSQCSDQACWDTQLTPIANNYPLIVGEMGQSSCAHDRIDTVVDWMEAKQQHYLVWAWWREPCNASAYYGLITDYLTGAPTPGYGQGYKDRLAALVGAPPVPPSFTTSASVNPASAVQGQSVAITANVTSATASTIVVDVEVHDPAGNKVFQRYYETESFAAGQTKVYPVSWPILASDEPGPYTVQIGVFTPGWVSELSWNNNAAQISVTTVSQPVSCAPRPTIQVVSRLAGPGRLEATVRAQTLPGTPTNSLSSVRLTRIDHAAVQLNGSPAAVGPAIPLPAGAQQATLLLTRQAPAQNPAVASTVAFEVVDACGPWPSFVGGGPNAF